MRSDGAAEGQLDLLDGGTGRDLHEVGEVDARLEGEIVNEIGRLIVEMPVLLEVGAVAARFAIEVHLANDAVLGERLEAIIDRGE